MGSSMSALLDLGVPLFGGAYVGTGSAWKKCVGLRRCAAVAGARSRAGILTLDDRYATLRDIGLRDRDRSAICRSRPIAGMCEGFEIFSTPDVMRDGGST